jgi:hypothetical protein
MNYPTRIFAIWLLMGSRAILGQSGSECIGDYALTERM